MAAETQVAPLPAAILLLAEYEETAIYARDDQPTRAYTAFVGKREELLAAISAGMQREPFAWPEIDGAVV